MPPAVSDSSTLIRQAMLGRLHLMHEFRPHVLIPTAVWEEVVEEARGRAGAREVEEAVRAGWLQVEGPPDQTLLRLLKRDLDDGEAIARFHLNLTIAVQSRAGRRARESAARAGGRAGPGGHPGGQRRVEQGHSG
ncbi:MAG: hypothetical protein M5U01_41005 [Ardenticatenaceae bacterium]|nr:hypothetical protein [Ardenticatenaceae bacterium]